MQKSNHWIVDVIADLKDFSQKEGYGNLAEALADAQVLALIEIDEGQNAAKNEIGMPPSGGPA